jgi:NAD(P) transhydrogenase
MQRYDLIVIGFGPLRDSAPQFKGRSWGSVSPLLNGETWSVVPASIPEPFPAKPCGRRCFTFPVITTKAFTALNYRVKEKITMADLSFRVQHVIKTEIDVTRAQLSRNGIELISGVAGFLDQKHLRVDSSQGQSEYEAEFIVVAPGTRPAVTPKCRSMVRQSSRATSSFARRDSANVDCRGWWRRGYGICLDVCRVGRASYSC